mmetsp:Transcript_9505/g.20048  ORF Transcript_9505/g.20048 Transcript_9505/m.20048 type:complete len:393 (+) Transcript_9505:148-1326(+)
MNSLIIRGYCLQLICFHSQLACGASITLGNDDVYTRYDRDAYLAARHGTKTTGQNAPVDKEDPSSYIKDRRRKTNDSRNDKTQHPYDDPNKCTTYLAQSSIPNSGLGMYTTIHYQKGEHFPFPEIGILLQEKQRHYSFSYGKKEEKELLINQYPWSAQILTLGAHEVGHGETIVPGLGMLANSHLGLVNMRHRESWKTQSWRDGTDTLHRTDSLTLDDMGRGAYSAHGRVVFEATKLVEPGEELFVSYGDEWFTNREELLGIIPGESQFTDADALLRSFSRETTTTTTTTATWSIGVMPTRGTRNCSMRHTKKTSVCEWPCQTMYKTCPRRCKWEPLDSPRKTRCVPRNGWRRTERASTTSSRESRRFRKRDEAPSRRDRSTREDRLRRRPW